jgi:hypothetical protein
MDIGGFHAGNNGLDPGHLESVAARALRSRPFAVP